jgi:NAD(P)-dependent dehydrogenase (short-subunit alcohol dehydrogenase family)
MLFSPNPLKDRTILITGATSGIGRETALLLGSLGAKLVITGRNLERLKDLELLLKAPCVALPADLGVSQGVESLFRSIPEEFQSIDGIFHAAGIEQIKPLTIVKGEDLRNVMVSSFESSLFLLKAISGRKDTARQKSVVIMSSVAAIRGQAGMSVYSASKAAIDGLVRSSACELAGKNIRVNSIVAGGVLTAMHDKIARRIGENSLKEYENKHLLGFGEAIDIANAAAFLLSDASKWITGTSMIVDGGYTCK